MSEIKKNVLPGVDVATFEAAKKDLLAYTGGLIAFEVFTADSAIAPRTPVSEVVKALTKIRELPDEEKPKWVVLIFGGWDNDTRAVVQIPECRSWCRQFVTMAGPELLSLLMWEPDASLFAQECGFGLTKLLVTAGYGTAEVSEGCDASEAGSIEAMKKRDADPENYEYPISYTLTMEGWALADAAMRCKQRAGFIKD